MKIKKKADIIDKIIKNYNLKLPVLKLQWLLMASLFYLYIIQWTMIKLS